MRPAYSECRHESSQRTGKTLRHPLHRNLGQNANGRGRRFLHPCQRNTQGQSSKTPSWIRTSNRQYLLPKHEMLYSNVSHTRPKISVKTIAHQNVSTLFKKTKIWLCIICAPSFSIYILWCTYYIGSYYLDILMNSPPNI
jgi:hypothetical protein